MSLRRSRLPPVLETPTIAHPLQRRWRAEELVRLRRADEPRRFLGPQRAGRIDANPHQIDAVAFALGRLPEGGCILADEVGLGKTIEAGLLIAQRWSEGARRILLVTPKPLLHQWRQELFELFGLETVEGRPEAAAFAGPGIYLCGREMAAGEKGQAALLEAGAMDLVVVDEAHEMFSGLYRRFRGLEGHDPEAPAARHAGRLYDLLIHWDAPVLLLTATPIQNALTELWSLVQYVDRTSTLLGQLGDFRELFCEGQGDRQVKPEAQAELRRRLQTVVKRTLRRQAQSFLEKPFVDRQARTFEYEPSAEERALYEDVTRYVMDPGTAAFGGRGRRLLLLGFHRRMASSRAALAQSLGRVAERLGRLEAGEAPGALELLEDLEDFEEDEGDGEEAVAPEVARAERARVEQLAARARGLGADTKLEALVLALRLVEAEARAGRLGGKVVIFTESLSTQDYLVERLVAGGIYARSEITVFRGDNRGPEAQAALAAWKATLTGRPPAADIAVRAALVHEFRTRTRLFISTEAGAKGLNLQFAETLVNYDLPWNPQRIEQRIGRCHRYGQTRAVTVLNFIAKGNDAERLLFEILSQKLELFGRVLDATDQVLHEPGRTASEALVSALGPGLEAELRKIHERARSQEEIVEELTSLKARVDEHRRAFEEAHTRAAGLIESHLDEEVQRVFRGHREAIRPELAELDRALEAVATEYLAAAGVPFARDGNLLSIADGTRLPPGVPALAAVGDHPGVASLHTGHPLVEAAVAEARRGWAGGAVAVEASDPVLAPLKGRRGRFALVWVRYDGLEPFDAFLPVLVLEGEDEAISAEVAARLAAAPMRDAASLGARAVDDLTFDDAVEEVLFDAGRAFDEHEAGRHRGRVERLERHMDDRALLLRRRVALLAARVERATEEREKAAGVEARAAAEERLQRLEAEAEAVEAKLAKVEARDDALYQRLRARGLARRYAPPTPERLFDVEVELT